MNLATMQDVSNFNVFDKYFVEYNKKKSELIDAMSVIFDSNKIDLLWLYLEKMSNSNLNDYHNGIPSISSVKKYLTNDNILKTLDKEYWTIVIHESKILNYVSSNPFGALFQQSSLVHFLQELLHIKVY